MFSFYGVKRVAVHMDGLQPYGIKLDFKSSFGGFRHIGYVIGGLFVFE